MIRVDAEARFLEALAGERDPEKQLKVGVELRLPYEMIYRHPFPGPGLGVRIPGEVSKEYADLLRHADHIYIVVLMPVRSVVVVGDVRR